MHNTKHKFAAFNSLIHRALNTPLSIQDKNKEIKIIKQLASENKFPSNTINKIIRKMETKILHKNLITSEATEKTQKNYRNFTYYGKINNQIEKKLQRIGITATYKNKTNLGKILTNYKPKVEDIFKSGVYEISCGDCGATYIGETGRALHTRIKEHTEKHIVRSS
jgi:hypothetical protein